MATGHHGVEQVAALEQLGDHDDAFALHEKLAQLDDVRRVHLGQQADLVEDFLLERALVSARELDDLHGVLHAGFHVLGSANLGESSATDGGAECVQVGDGPRVGTRAPCPAFAAAVRRVDRGGVEDLVLRWSGRKVSRVDVRR